MENQPGCSSDQKIAKIIDGIEAADDEKVPLEIKDCFWKNRNEEKSRKAYLLVHHSVDIENHAEVIVLCL